MRPLERTYTTDEFASPEDCDYCRTGRACYRVVEEYGPDPDEPGDPGERLIIHMAAS